MFPIRLWSLINSFESMVGLDPTKEGVNDCLNPEKYAKYEDNRVKDLSRIVLYSPELHRIFNEEVKFDAQNIVFRLSYPKYYNIILLDKYLKFEVYLLNRDKEILGVQFEDFKKLSNQLQLAIELELVERLYYVSDPEHELSMY